LKSTHTLAFLLLSFMLPVASFAATHNKEITLDKATKVGATELQPGTYKVSWNGNGPNVEVDFLKNRKVVANTTAKLGNAQGGIDSVQTRTLDADSAILEELDFKNTQLVFPTMDQQSGN
jgi:hypothetical protein